MIKKAQNYQNQKQLEQANCLYQQVLELDPENIAALNGLGLIAMEAGMSLLAVEFFNFACDINPDHITVNKNLALVYSKMLRYDEAILHYIHLLNLDENNAEVHGQLARLYLQAGNSHHALSHYKFAFILNPAEPGNFHGLVQLDAKSITAENINTVEKLLLKPGLPLEVRSSFYFSLAAVYDICERYDQAFANYSVANISKAAVFDVEQHTNTITNIINTFDPDFFKKYAGCELNGSSQPVFIVGMPCSGTGLVETILSANTKIFTAGELDHIHQISQKLEIHTDSIPDNNFSVAALNNFARYYLNEINNLASARGQKKPEKIINTLSENYLQLALIALLFPKAHIIHCVRNPLDVCLSNYFEDFSADRSYAYEQKNIVFYYKQYQRLMQHWQNVLPVDIHTVNYEDLLISPATTAKELFKFIGLNWQPECIEFLTTQHNVDSVDQVQLKSSAYAHFLIKELLELNQAEVLKLRGQT